MSRKGVASVKKKFGFIISLLSLGIVFFGIGIIFLVDYSVKQNPYSRPERRYYLYWEIFDESNTQYYSLDYDKLVVLEIETPYIIELCLKGGPRDINIETIVFECDSSIFEIECITPYDPVYPTECLVQYSLYCKKKTENVLLHIYVENYLVRDYPEDYYQTINIIIE
ncbi:MAG: hypothetical protein K2N64_00990 [Anaeroplasmataceae bacterium]|nr:hypothetical protein [Anaeroplasmataceae bacterium]